jgi:membrane protein YdbS with pleckstrin-like domain
MATDGATGPNYSASSWGVAAWAPLRSYITLGVFAITMAWNYDLSFTEDEILVERGVLRTETLSFGPNDIVRVEHQQNPLERIAGYGRVRIISDGFSRNVLVPGLKDHQEAAKTLRKRVSESE